MLGREPESRPPGGRAAAQEIHVLKRTTNKEKLQAAPRMRMRTEQHLAQPALGGAAGREPASSCCRTGSTSRSWKAR
jgi:hypothetical protein